MIQHSRDNLAALFQKKDFGIFLLIMFLAFVPDGTDRPVASSDNRRLMSLNELSDGKTKSPSGAMMQIRLITRNSDTRE